MVVVKVKHKLRFLSFSPVLSLDMETFFGKRYLEKMQLSSACFAIQFVNELCSCQQSLPQLLVLLINEF